jgi:N-acetylglucosamine-6-sulfatase
MAGKRAQNVRAGAGAPGDIAGRVRRGTQLAPLLMLLFGAALLGGCGSSGGGAVHTHTRSVATGTVGPPPREVGTQGSLERERPVHPNIVFVLTDDLAWNLVRFMPHVLRLEHDGATFTNYYVTDSLCCPSRASIFTGRFPHDTHVFDNSAPEGGYGVFHARGEERQTFAVALQHVGYRTAMMGKYLNGYEPGESERDRPRPGVPPGWNEWDVAGDGYPEYGYRMNSDGRVRRYGYTPRDYLTDVLARKGLRFIDRAAAARRPFLLEIATFAPHAPFTPAPRDTSAFPGLRAPRTPAFNTVGVHEPAWLSSYVPLDAAQIAGIDAKFRERAQAVQAVDRMIGEIEQELAAKELARDTYIVFSSDNGLHMGEHRLEPGKLTAFDTDIRVPLIVAGPGVPAGRTVPQMAENIDLCPSFEQLAGARIPPTVDGHSLVGLLRGRAPANWRREILVEHHGKVLDAGDPDLPTAGAGNPPSYEAIRTAESLYVEYVTGEREYYNLRSDPYELDNIVASLPPAKLRRLHRTLLGIEHCHDARACWRAEHAPT